MRGLLAAVLIAAAVWSGYWMAGKMSVQSGWRDWVEERQSADWQIAVEDTSVHGFPNRFDTALKQLSLQTPDGQFAFQTDLLQLLRLSYKRDHVIAITPEPLHLTAGATEWTLTAPQARTSLVLQGTIPRRLDRMVTETGPLRIDGPLIVEGSSSRIALRQSPLRTDMHDLAIDAAGLALTLTGGKPVMFDSLALTAQLRFSQPLDGNLDAGLPALRSIDIQTARLVWNGADLHLSGMLDRASDGSLSGTLTLRAQNWHDVLTGARTASALPEPIIATLEGALGTIAAQSGEADMLDMPLTFKEGVILLGPIPLGPAPRLSLAQD